MTSLWSPRVQVTPSRVRVLRVLQCAPRQRVMGPSQGAARLTRTPPGRFESQLEPPGSWVHQRDSRLSSKQFPMNEV
jgi:hypothetical protein